MPDTWYRDFFSGETLNIWRQAVSPEETRAEVEFLISALNLGKKKGAALLDLPCGYGRLSLPLAKRGYKLTGLDTSSQYIDEAKQSFAKAGLKGAFITGEMQELSELSKMRFDGAFCMGNSFGYFDRKQTQDFLKSLSSLLKSESGFVLESRMVAESFFTVGAEKEWLKVGDTYMLIENKFFPQEGKLETVYTYISEETGKCETKQPSHWIFTAAEVASMLEQAGFMVVGFYSSFELEPFQLGSERFLALCVKAD